jgi:hypothetical protein
MAFDRIRSASAAWYGSEIGELDRVPTGEVGYKAARPDDVAASSAEYRGCNGYKMLLAYAEK